MKLRPLGDRALIKISKEEEVTTGGIVLPDTIDKEKKAEGIVMSLGEGEKIKALQLKEGDKVLFGKYAGEEVTIDKEDYKILTHEEILGVYTD